MNQKQTYTETKTYEHRFHSGEYPLLNGNGTDVDFSNVIIFNEGIPGFEFLTQFLVVPLNDYPPFQVLQSLESPEVAMLVLPVKFMELSEELKIKKSDLDKIQIRNETDLDMFTILKVSGEEGKFTANTKAPMIFNFKEKLGAQVILEHPALDIQHPLELI